MDRSAPLVSIVIPNYNYDRYLRQAIDSALGQTYPHVEVIVVDDGSSDQSEAVLRGYGDRIRWFRQQRQGVSAARNRGIGESRGELIAFLDADDSWAADKLEKQVALMREGSVGIVCCGMQFIGPSDEPLGVSVAGRRGRILRELVLLRWPGAPGLGSTALIRRECIERVGLFDEKLSTSADWDLWRRIACCYDTEMIHEPLVRYRLHRSSMHCNVDLFEHDMVRAFERAFADPAAAAVRPLKRRCYANLYLMLSGSHLRAGRWDKCVAYALRSLWSWPPSAVYLAAFPMRRIHRRWRTRIGDPAAQIILPRWNDRMPLQPRAEQAARSATGAQDGWPPSSSAGRGILYLSYDGALEPLGESQVVAYLERLACRHEITLLSFEKAHDVRDRGRVAAMRSRLAQAGIRWVPLRYHKRPPILSTAWDVLRGIGAGLRACRQGRIGLIHARGYVPSLMAVALARLFRIRFLFDMRGFWADERMEAGHWGRRSLLYRVAKRCERLFFESADAVVSLTEEGVKALASLGYGLKPHVAIEVIPTCVDLARFSPGPKDPALASRLDVEDRLVIGCTGTMSNWYLRRPMLQCLAYLLSQLDSAKALIVTREAHDRLRAEAVAAGIPEARLALEEAPFSAMPDYLRLMDVGLFFIAPSFAKKGSAATKLAEFLASGVPVVINDGVGDSGRIVRDERVGVVLPSAEPSAYPMALEQLRRLLDDPAVRRRCRKVAAARFDVEQGSAAYAALYERLIAGAHPVPPLRDGGANRDDGVKATAELAVASEAR